MGTYHLLLALQVLALTAAAQAYRSRCDRHACHPPPGNLAIGRLLRTTTTCGEDGGEHFCSVSSSSTCSKVKCYKCHSGRKNRAHPPRYMTDTGAGHRGSWWQSKNNGGAETIQLDLESRFYFTHLVMVFRTPRPAAMVLERSSDYGKSWRTYSYFARNCTETFGLREGVNPEGSLCTSRYSTPDPCTRGEVIFRALPVGSNHTISDPYSLHAQELMTITNIRMRLLKRQSCNCPAEEVQEKPYKFAHFAVYNLIISGSCFCNGHADVCVPIDGRKVVGPGGQSAHLKVNGKCVCRHNTAGVNCERCAPLYNDQPWKPGNGRTGKKNMCEKCDCNSHADSCHFDLNVWRSTNGKTGGVCDDCQHHTMGRRCHRCRPGYYQDHTKDKAHPQICKKCVCDPVGTVDGISGKRPCNMITGRCKCKNGVTGTRCDRCKPNYWGFGKIRNGCQKCNCGFQDICDPETGACRPIKEDTEPDFQQYISLQRTDHCKCLEETLKDPELLCDKHYDFALRARVKDAHDLGSHVAVTVQIRKVILSKTVSVEKGEAKVWPTSWAEHGCTCPIMNVGEEYLLTGFEDVVNNRLIVNETSYVKEWAQATTRDITRVLRKVCT
ncbi:netrin-4-like [Branchiostoma lanceolatum]|uniref:netrin-4-like n=1 Tax=Branchiostoma lanceolatum TaxID=7740 RepID=UPI003452C28A